MQRKHIPREYEYQSSKSSHPVDDRVTRVMTDIKHQPDTVLVDICDLMGQNQSHVTIFPY